MIKIEEVATCQCGTPFWRNRVNQTLCPDCHDKTAQEKKRESRIKCNQARRGYVGINVRDIARDMRKEARYAMH